MQTTGTENQSISNPFLDWFFVVFFIIFLTPLSGVKISCKKTVSRCLHMVWYATHENSTKKTSNKQQKQKKENFYEQ